MMKRRIGFLLITGLVCAPSVLASQDIDMAEVRRLAKLSVEEIIPAPPVERFALENYWRNVKGRNKPLVVFFYSNHDDPSQRVATLLRYIAPDYTSKLSFAMVKVVETGQPDKPLAGNLMKEYSLDKTPGILYYDNVGDKMVLEEEDYIDADFKEFRTPSMLLWKTYYDAVRKELDKLLAD